MKWPYELESANGMTCLDLSEVIVFKILEKQLIIYFRSDLSPQSWTFDTGQDARNSYKAIKNEMQRMRASNKGGVSLLRKV